MGVQRSGNMSWKVLWFVCVLALGSQHSLRASAASDHNQAFNPLLRQMLVQTGVAQDESGVPEDIEMFMRPPIAAAEQPTLVSKTDNSLVISWVFDTSTELIKAVDVTNVTTLAGLSVTTNGQFHYQDGQVNGLSTNSSTFFHLHPIFEAYVTHHLNLTLPLYVSLPQGKHRVFLRKPVKLFVVEVKINDPSLPAEHVDDDGWTTAASLDATEGQAEIENLLPGTEYRTRVCSANSQGKGVCSPSTLVDTSNVPSKPGRPALVHATSKSLELDIAKPGSTNGSPLTEITLEVSRMHNGPWNRLQYAMEVRKKLITDLEPGMTYFFRTRAWNQIGPSEYSDVVSFETLAMVPKQVPGFEVGQQWADMATATTQVVLVWGTSDPRGRPVTDYELQKAMGGGTDDSEFLLECLTETHNCTVKGLRAGKMYHFRVRAINNVGPSNWTDPLEVITAPSVTTAPEDLEVTATAPHSISLQWAPPRDFHGAPPSSYLLQMQTIPLTATPDPTKGVYWNEVYRGPGLQATVGADKVLAAHSYSFRVKALNLVGSSNASAEVRASTQATVPDAPSAPVVVNMTSTAVNLTWTVPEPNGAPIVSYRLKLALASAVIQNTSTSNSSRGVNESRGDQVLLSSGVSVMLGSLVSAEEEQQQAVFGRSKASGKPCKAISPSVYDSPVPARFMYPSVIPGSQAVYPERPGNDRQATPPASASPAPLPSLLPNTTAQTPSNSTTNKQKMGKDGFMVAYSGNLTVVEVTGLTPGQSYVFAVQATSEIGTSPMSPYAVVAMLPDVPLRPRAPRMDSRGHNFISFSWPPAMAQGAPVLSYVVQIAETNDKHGEPLFENTCVTTWPPEFASDEIVSSFTNRRDSRLEKGLSDSQAELDVHGVPMDHCKHTATANHTAELQCCVDGLEPEKVYKFRVLAISAVGLSPFGPAAEIRTTGDIPQTSLTPRIVNGTSTSLNVAWEAAPAGTSNVRSVSYIVQLAEVEFGATVDVYTGPSLNTTVSGLLPAHSYWLRVQAENHNGKGAPSEFMHAQTCSAGVTCSGSPATPLPAPDSRDSEIKLIQTQMAMNEKLRRVGGVNLHQHALSPRRPAKHH